MIDLTKPLQMKMGSEVTLLCIDERNKQILGYIGDGFGIYKWWLHDGTYSNALGRSEFDLMNVPPPPPKPVEATRYLVWREYPKDCCHENKGKIKCNLVDAHRLNLEPPAGVQPNGVIIKIEEVKYKGEVHHESK